MILIVRKIMLFKLNLPKYDPSELRLLNLGNFKVVIERGPTGPLYKDPVMAIYHILFITHITQFISAEK